MSTAKQRTRWAFLIIYLLVLLTLGMFVDAGRLFPGLRIAVQRPGGALPSTVVVPAIEVVDGAPLLSVYVDHADLHDPERGILANRRQAGRAWERRASMSYFDEGQLVFASGVGIRIHGGSDRLRPGKQSFRLYFRRQYGADQFRPGVLFDDTAEPLRHLVLDRDEQSEADGVWHFINPLSYDIARQIGGITVQTKPIRFFLNGEWQGVYVLSEHISDQFLESHFGHSDFLHDVPDYQELSGWLGRQDPLTLARVAQEIDMSNLTRWLLSVLFLGTTDAMQGPGQFRDARDPEGRWFWINWDMDGSFSRRYGEPPWEFDTFQDVLDRAGAPRRLRRRSEPRPELLTTLLAEDEAYREYFKRIFVEVMNHRLTQDFLTERFEYYRHIAHRYGVEHLKYLDTLRDFLTYRPAELRRLAEEHLNTPPSVRFRIVAPRDVELRVNGTAVRSGFEGYYFPNMSVEVAVAESSRSRLSQWLVNGRPVGREPVLRLRAEEDVTIEPVLQ